MALILLSVSRLKLFIEEQNNRGEVKFLSTRCFCEQNMRLKIKLCYFSQMRHYKQLRFKRATFFLRKASASLLSSDYVSVIHGHICCHPISISVFLELKTEFCLLVVCSIWLLVSIVCCLQKAERRNDNNQSSNT